MGIIGANAFIGFYAFRLLKKNVDEYNTAGSKKTALEKLKPVSVKEAIAF